MIAIAADPVPRQDIGRNDAPQITDHFFARIPKTLTKLLPFGADAAGQLSNGVGADLKPTMLPVTSRGKRGYLCGSDTPKKRVS